MASRSERYRSQNRLTRKSKRRLLPGIVCALIALYLLTFLWTIPTEKGELQTNLAEDFTQTESLADEDLLSSDDGTIVINSNHEGLNTPGVNGIKEKGDKKNNAKDRNAERDKKKKDVANSSKSDKAKKKKGKKESNDLKSKKDDASVGSGYFEVIETQEDDSSKRDTKEKDASKSENTVDSKSEDSDTSDDSTESIDRNAPDVSDGAVIEEDVNEKNNYSVALGEPEEGEKSTSVADEHDKYDYSGWGYRTYAEYVEQHPIKARLTYARLCMLSFLSSAQPAGCTSCSRISESVPESTIEVERPQSGQIFEKSGQGSLPQLVVIAPDDKDAFVKLKRSDGDVVLSFYVRSGTKVKACVPVGECDFYYALGDNWKGEADLFGAEGTYAKSDRALNFTSPLNTYEYRFGLENGNVTPKTISATAF